MTARTYLELAAVAIIILAVSYLAFCEHQKGEAEIKTQDTHAVAAEQHTDAAVVVADTAIVKSEAVDYAKALDAPVLSAPVIGVCVNAPSALPAASKTRPRPLADGGPVVREPNPAVPTVIEWNSKPVVRAGRDADAQIKGLQDYINRVCPTL